MAEKAKKKKSCKKVKLIQWHYDNGDIGAVLKGETEYFHPVTLKSESEKDKEYEWLKKQEKAEKLTIKIKDPYELPVGISVYMDQYQENTAWGIEQRKDALSEFMKMIRADGKKGVQQFIVKLTALTLSSYWLRQALEMSDIIDAYPIDNIDAAMYACVTKCEDMDSLTALKKICGSIMVSTAKCKDTPFKIKAPTLLPYNRERELLSTAWLKLRKDKNRHLWPAPYRDMAVLWDKGFLEKPKELKEFMDRNSWCTCVIFGKTAYPKRIEVRLEGKGLLDRLKADWSIEGVKKLIAAYAFYMPKYFHENGKEFLRVWDLAGDRLKCHLENQGKAEREKRNSECFRDRILLSALISFMEFAYQTCQLPLDEAIALRKQLLTALLPKCYPKETKEEKAATQRESLEQFEKVLRTLITTENLKHFYPLKGYGPIWLEETEDGTDIWGYIRKIKEAGKKQSVPCVVIRKETLINLVQAEYPEIASFRDVLSRAKKERPSYLHKTETIHIKRDPPGPKTDGVCILTIEELPISSECIQALTQLLEE